MPSFSEVRILGYVANDIGLKAGKGKNYLQVMLGVTKAFKPRPPEKKWNTRTRYIKVMFFGPYAVYCAERFSRGDLIYVTGEIDVSERIVDGIKRYEMYILGKHAVPITQSKKKHNDPNYGVDPAEINDDSGDDVPF